MAQALMAIRQRPDQLFPRSSEVEEIARRIWRTTRIHNQVIDLIFKALKERGDLIFRVSE